MRRRSLTVAEERLLAVEDFAAVLTGRGWRRAGGDEDVTACTLLFSLFALPLPLAFPLLLLQARKRWKPMKITHSF